MTTLLFALLSLAAAQTPTPAAPVDTPAVKVLGWSKTATLGLNLSFTSTESVIGQTDGSAQTYGGKLETEFNHLTESDEWRNAFTLEQATTRTPSLPRYVKSNDEAKYTTIYMYPFVNYPSLAPYLSGEVSAPLFKGEDVQSTSKTYRIVKTNQTRTGTSLRLTDGFKPTTSKEGIGVLWKAVEKDRLKIEIRSGVGALQINAKDQLTVQGTNDAGEILIGELSNVSQVGLEVGVTAKGKIDEKSTYSASVELLTPFISNKASSDRRDPIQLTSIDGKAQLTSKVTEWASFSYDYKLKIQPQLQTRAQQTHMLVLNVNYNLL